MKKIWTNKTAGNGIIDNYCFSDGAKYDNHLVLEDVYGSIAHAAMLGKIGVIKNGEFLKFKKTLIEIINLYHDGKFVVIKEDEDVNTKVEAYLTNKLGDLGKKIHTGRSRNDQVLVDLRLYSKKELLELAYLMIGTVNSFLNFAENYKNVPMPGYTHMQKAMPSSVGLWAGSFAEQLAELLEIVNTVYDLNDQSPLGTGAAYGVSLPIDREFTAKMLGFAKVQNNSLYTQISRLTFQLAILQALVQIMLAASRFASDLLLFTTSEFGFFNISETICTGSSIMPQKKNLDLMEYVRANANIVIGNELKTATIASGLPSGYNADFGATKGIFMDSISITKETLDVLKMTLDSITPNEKVLGIDCTEELYATHHAYLKVMAGLPFRDAYLEVKEKFKVLPTPNPKDFLKESVHTGGTGNLKLGLTKNDLLKKKKFWKKQNQKYQTVISSLLA